MQISTARSRRFTTADAAEIAATHYDLDALPEALAGEFDDNFQLTTPSGVYVLKIMREGCEKSFVEMQIAVLDRLRDAGCAVPQVAVTPQMNAIVAAEGRLVWMLKWLPGGPLADARPRTTAMARDLGELLGRIDRALTHFDHPAAHRELKWDLARAGWIREYVHHIDDEEHRGLVERILAEYDASVSPALGKLRYGAIHGDANDHNVLVAKGAVTGLIDFGDLHYTALVAEPAIAATYAAFGSDRPLEMIAAVAAGYHQTYPLTEDEISLLFPLVLTRLAVSVTNSAYLKSISADPYATVSEDHAWRALELLSALPARLPTYVLRRACGLDPVPQSAAITAWIKENAASFAPVLQRIDLRTEPCVVFDLSVGSLLLGANPSAIETPALTKTLFEEMSRANVRVGIGRYDEARALYLTDSFATGTHPTDDRRTVHIGLDLFIEAGAAVCAPLDGVVHSFANRAAKCDYGPVIILKHEPAGAPAFFTLYGHLSLESLDGLQVGKKVALGERFATIGVPPINGDWTSHLHFQIIADLLDYVGDFPGVCLASQREVWLSNSPDPNLMVGIPGETFPLYDVPNVMVTMMREKAAGPSLSLSYREPLQIVRGWRQYLYDETGRAYLDTYNNVPLVGHSHPHVVEAVQRQIALLNTNTRYLHFAMAKYAGLLADACGLDVCYFVNSASEANELAIRMARADTGREDIIVLEHAYHGHTNTLIDISPYKFDGPGGRGRMPWVHVATMPDDYRGLYRRDDPERGVKYAQRVANICERTSPAAFIAESLPSVGGQMVLPRGYLREAYKHVRAAGGVCIADEVQVGFGRLGEWMWGYQMQGVKPDIVVLGKPIANGFPLGAVVTTREIADSFNNGMEFFSTFGGNPVAIAAGQATLDVLQHQRLQDNARDVGAYWIKKLRALMQRHEIIGDVRGAGLFLGVELVRNLGTLEPAAEEAAYVVNRLRERGILTGTDGPHHNVIKLRPPLIFTKDDADFFVRVFDEVLGEDAVTANLDA